jgi:V-type H+-transporting ATPase subunit C
LLISLSEELPKQDAALTATVAKTVDTLRNLLNNDPLKLAQHVQINEASVDGYLLGGWKWNEGRYGVQRGLREMVDVLTKVPLDLGNSRYSRADHSSKEMASIDNAMKAKLNNYNLVKGSLTQMQRKKQ